MMSLTPISTLLLSLLFIFLHQSAVATSSLSANSDQLSAYDILQSYNFPAGLLPKGITQYDIDRETGQFHAYLDGTCSFSLEGSYQLKYKSKISGYISENKLTSLTGVSVKVLFLWLNIVEVTRNGDDIDFSVGIASASFAIDNFYECPQCGCGLDCVSGQFQTPCTCTLGCGRNLEFNFVHLDLRLVNLTVVGKLRAFPLRSLSSVMEYTPPVPAPW
ncbi:F22D16.19 protein [Citrus sinensis]|nr:F22D16.19 protein [Citrus sinensis]